jgi:hypothetical protein
MQDVRVRRNLLAKRDLGESLYRRFRLDRTRINEVVVFSLIVR